MKPSSLSAKNDAIGRNPSPKADPPTGQIFSPTAYPAVRFRRSWGMATGSPLAQAFLAWLVALSCLLAAGPARAQFFSPGPLAKAHGHIDGDENCSECHSAGRRVENDKCGSCHQDVERSVRERRGLHGLQFAGKSCGECHVDHRGENHDLISWDPDTFDHQDAGWALVGAHTKVACRTCHDRKNERGAETFFGLSTDCGSCHNDVHTGRFGDECLDCHGQSDWKTVKLDDFDHDLSFFPLRGKHQKVKCEKCHGEPAKYQPLEFSTCGSCHEDPHRGRFGTDCKDCHGESGWKDLHMARSAHPGLSLRAGHAKAKCADCHDQGNLAPPSKGDRCVSCHAPVHEANFGKRCESCHQSIRWLGLPDSIGRRAHSRTAYPLEGRHEKVACGSCHDKSLPTQKRFRELDFDGCADCHSDPHQGQFQDRQAGECGPCHDTQGFAPTLFGVDLHATTEFSLEGGHEAAPCGSCHTETAIPRARGRLGWQIAERACASCHENPHGDQFTTEMAQGGCGHCHTTAAWDVPNIAHDTWPLTGAHQKARCDQCHTPTEEDRRAGTGVSYREAPRECEGCHVDVHFGQFRLSEPVLLCQQCHTTRTFAVESFAHEERTGFPLVGKHAQVDCKQCHTEQVLSDGRKTNLWRLPYNDCRDCHKNPHTEGE